MPIVFLTILCCLMTPLPARAQGPLDEDANRFSRVLSELKISAEQLSKGNTVLLDRNKELRGHLEQLQLRMQKLLEEHNGLMKASAKLQEERPSLSRRIRRLEDEVDELSGRIKQRTAEEQAASETVERSRKEAEQLGKKLGELGAGQAAAAAEPQPDPAAEKLRLLKMIDASKEKQAYLYQQIANARQNLPMSAIVSVQVPKDKDSLINQSRQLQEEVDQLAKMAGQAEAPDVVDDTVLRRLQSEMDDLQKNHDQLADLVSRTQQKLQKTGMTKEQRIEQGHLQESLEDLDRDARRLKADLHDLRKQMVDLDKRKTILDSQLHN